VGLFYASTVLRTEDADAVTRYLREAGREAYVSPPAAGCTVVYDRECEDQDERVIRAVASGLSAALGVPAFAALLHDDDVFMYWLFRDGVCIDRYDSTPGYFDTKATELFPPEGGDARLLCETFGRPDEPTVTLVERILHASEFAREPRLVPNAYGGEAPGDEPSAQERHERLAAALGWPPFAAGIGHDGIRGGFLPPGLEGVSFTYTSRP
jgi:hypothetical protein